MYSNVTMRSLTDCELFVINREALSEVLYFYPEGKLYTCMCVCCLVGKESLLVNLVIHVCMILQAKGISVIVVALWIVYLNNKFPLPNFPLQYGTLCMHAIRQTTALCLLSTVADSLKNIIRTSVKEFCHRDIYVQPGAVRQSSNTRCVCSEDEHGFNHIVCCEGFP